MQVTHTANKTTTKQKKQTNKQTTVHCGDNNNETEKMGQFFISATLTTFIV